MKHFTITQPTPRSTLMTCPAYTILYMDPAEADSDRALPSVTAGRTVYVQLKNWKGEETWKGFRPGSVVSYAQSYSECPIAAIEDTKHRMERDPHAGHKLHWFNPKAISLTSHKQPHEVYMGLKLGERFRFEGRIFSLKAASNNNVDMIDHGPANF